MTVKLWRWALAYIFFLSIFAGIFDVLWHYSPDYFVVGREVNLLPFEQLKALSQGTQLAPTSSIGLDDASRRVEGLQTQLSALQQTITDMMKEGKNREVQLDRLAAANNTAAAKNLKILESDAIHELYRDAELIKRQIEALNRSIEQQSDHFIKIQLSLQARILEADAANIDVKIAKKRSEIFDLVLRDWTIIADSQVQKAYSQLITQQIDAFHALDDTINRLGNLREEIHRTWYSLYQARMSQLGLFDFIYFSIITASTTGYGDIIPNHSIVRMLVSFEILCSNVFLGLFITRLANLRR